MEGQSSQQWNNEKSLSEKPFLVFDLRDFTRADLDDISSFHLQLFDVKNILKISSIFWGENSQNEYGGPASASTKNILNSLPYTETFRKHFTLAVPGWETKFHSDHAK